MSGRASSGRQWLRENFHRSAWAPPASRGHAGRISPPYLTAGHALNHDFAVSLTPKRPAWTTPRKRKARSGDKLQTLRVTYKVIMHPMATRSVVAQAA